MSARHISAVLADVAWDRWEVASARARASLSGKQFDLFDTAFSEMEEWRGIALACEREALRVEGRA